MRLRAVRAGPALAALLLTAGCGEQPTEEPVIRPVRYQPVFATGGERVRSFSGTARAGQESRLSFRVGGTVQRIAVAVGDRVARGDLIARLDPVDYEIRVQDARAALTRDQASARQAQANYERVRQLWENKNASRAELDQARAASESAAAAVASSERKLELAQINLGYTTLAAPADGAISEVSVEVSENVSPGQVVAVLTSGRRAEVTAAVPEQLIGDVREGDAVTVRFDALGGREFAARVTEVGVTAAAAGAAFSVAVRLDEGADDVRPGMAAEVSFRFGRGEGRETIRVPAHCVLEDRDGRFAFVVEPDGEGFGTVHRRSVSVGELTAEGLEILDGLADGDFLVTAGMTRVRDGMRVRVPEKPGS